MIVKNEILNLERCLNSLYKHIDYWVINDTGSSDGTQDFILDFFKQKNITGELFSSDWVDFSFNRNVALEKARFKCDYILLCDADMELVEGETDLKNFLSNYNFDLGYVSQKSNFLLYDNIRLINGSKQFKYFSPTHEYINPQFNNPRFQYIPKKAFYFLDHASGSNRVNKFQRDIELLEKAIIKEKDNQRYYFYLAQSYRDSGNVDKAIEHYKKVLTLNGYLQEKYCACLYLGRLYNSLKELEKSIFYFLKAVEYDKNRIETIVEATNLLRDLNNHKLVCMLYDTFKDYNKDVNNILFKELELYKNYLEFNFSVSAYYSNRKEEGKKVLKNLLADRETSYILMEQAKKNSRFYDL